MVLFGRPFTLPEWSAGQMVALGTIALVASGWAFTTVIYHQSQQKLQREASTLTQSYELALASDHQRTLQQKTLESQIAQLKTEYETFKSEPAQQKQAKIDGVLSLYGQVKAKVDRNTGLKLDTSGVTNQYTDWGNKILAQEFDAVTSLLSKASADLDAQYKTYQASLITPTPKPVAAVATSAYGYAKQTVATGRGSFSAHVIKLKLSEVTIKTVSASTGDCANNCPTKSLAQYIAENGAYAGMNGTYFCPPDYASCAGKVNSFDFGFYNSNSGTWINRPAANWDSVGLATFNGSSPSFYHYGNQYTGHGVTAAISNFPPLLVKNGQVVTNESQQDAYQKTKGTKGALGVDGTSIYLALVSSASMTDLAHVMQSLGARDVLNLDGGGSSAMWIGGGYKVGPGRSLPNAIVLVRR
jgi:hypothetical protein